MIFELGNAMALISSARFPSGGGRDAPADGAGGGGRRGRSRRGKRNLRQHGVAQFGLSGGKLAGLENVSREVGGLLPRKAPGQVEGHRLLNLVDESPPADARSSSRGNSLRPAAVRWCLPSPCRDIPHIGPGKSAGRALPARRSTRLLLPIATARHARSSENAATSA